MQMKKSLETIVEKTKHSYLAKAVPLTFAFGALGAGLVTGHYYEALSSLEPMMTAAATTFNNIEPEPVSLSQIAACLPLITDIVKLEAKQLYDSFNIWLPVTTALTGLYGAATAFVWHNWQKVSEKAVKFYHEGIVPAGQALKSYFQENKEYAIKGALIGGAIFTGLAMAAVNKDIDSAINFVQNFDNVQIIGQYLARTDRQAYQCLGEVIMATPVDNIAVAALEHTRSYPAEMVKSAMGGSMLGAWTGAAWGSSKEYYIGEARKFKKELIVGIETAKANAMDDYNTLIERGRKFKQKIKDATSHLYRGK